MRRILRKVNDSKLDSKYRKSLNELRQNLVDIRIYVNAYEFSEERGEQISNAKSAKKWLEQARQNILRASEDNIFSAIEVAHLTAEVDQTKADLK